MNSPGDGERRALAERLARLTEQAVEATGAGDSTADERPLDATDPPGLVALERVIRAFSSLHREDAGEISDVAFVWGHLQVRELIGSGSYGDVYRAFDRVLQRDVALKLRRGDEMSARGYILEARRLARVRHPHVLAVHGAAVHGGRAGLWCDLIDGQSLSAWIGQSGPQPASTVLEAGSMLASALQTVHQAGLIHGDVKPGNIMHASDGRLILMDFGTAVEEADAGVHAIYGSPLAMAPEQIDGSRSSSAVDLYALGVVLYFMACGRYPLQAESLAALAAQHARAAQPDWSALRARCGRDLGALIERLLSRNPAKRPDAGATLHALHAIIDAPRRRRRRWLVAGIVATLCTALIISLLSLQRAQREQHAAAQSYQRETTVRGFMSDLLNAPRPHIGGANARVIDVLADAVPVAEQRFSDDPAVLAAVLGTIGTSYSSIGAHSLALPILTRAMELGERQQLAPEVLLPIRLRLAAGKAYLDPSAETTARLKALFESSRSQLGDSHHVTIQAALLLSARQLSQDDAAATERTLRFILEQRADNETRDDASVMARIHLLGLLGAQQRWDEAAATFKQAMEIAAERGMLGSSVGITLRSAGATLAIQRGHFAEAESQLQSVLADTERHFGSRHQNLRAVLNHLAISQRMQGNHAAAIDSLRRALQLASSQLPDDHREVLSLRDNLASSLYDSGDHGSALELREQVLASKLRILGPRHEETLLSAVNLAEQYVEDGDPVRGRSLALTASADADAVFGAQHPYTLEAREIAARAQLSLGNAGAARDQLNAIHASKREAIGADNLYTLRCAGFLADALAANGEQTAALSLLRATVATLQAQVGDEQPDLLRIRAQLNQLESARK